jgi:hypothetical protein
MKCGNKWPFNNIGYHLDEQLISEDTNAKIVMKTVLLFYTCPFDILLEYTRTVHNHSFAKYSNIIQQRSIEWICDNIDNFDQLNTTLNVLARGHLNTLHLHYYKLKVSILIDFIFSVFFYVDSYIQVVQKVSGDLRIFSYFLSLRVRNNSILFFFFSQ